MPAIAEHAGTFERWLMRGAVTVLIIVIGWVAVQAMGRQSAETKALTRIAQNQAVIRNQIEVLTSNVNDVRSLAQRVAKLETVQSEHERRITKLENAK